MARPERVPLSSIKTLVLYANEFTRSRRTSPVLQLECTGSVCRDFQPSSVYCTKAGDSDWKCEADLPASLRFGKLHVSCEGWDRPGDPYVLKGSCGLTYSLVRTPSGNHYGPSGSTDYTTSGCVHTRLALDPVGTGGVARPEAVEEMEVGGGPGEEVGEDVAAAPARQTTLHLPTPSTHAPANQTRMNPGDPDSGQVLIAPNLPPFEDDMTMMIQVQEARQGREHSWEK